MSHRRFTYKTIPAEYADFSRWRTVDVTDLPEEEQERFTRLKRGIETYLGTGKLTVAGNEANYSRDNIIKQLNRCVAVAADGRLWGWGGLLKGIRIKPYHRRSQLPQGSAGEIDGFAGCFTKFLESHDDIRQELDALILKKKTKRNKGHEARISIRDLTTKFVDLCLEHGVRENEYPLNVASKAKRSIGRYLRLLVESQPGKGTRARHGKDAAKRLSVGTGESSFPLSHAPYDVADLDAHEIHCIGCVIVPGPAGPQTVAIERLWIILTVDDVSSAILGYSVGIRTEVSSATVEESLISSTRPWQPRKLSIPGMSYREGAGLPSGIIPELAGCFPAVLKMDNAAQHYAKRIAESARRRLGCAVTWGPVGHWEHNALVERIFKTLELYGFQRLPSTTGSNVEDPIKDDPIKNARKEGITWEGLLDLIDVLVANYNATPNMGIGGQTPLQVLQDQLHSSDPTFLPRILPPPSIDCPDLGIVVEVGVVRGNQQKGRRPYVQLDRVRYTSPVLARSFGFVGSKLRLHIRESNMCSIEVYFESGQHFGTLRAQGKWGRTPHTREMRKQIFALADAGELTLSSHDDPVEALLQYYSNKAYRDVTKRPNSVSRAATKLVNAVVVSGLDVPSAKQPNQDPTNFAGDNMKPTRPIPSTIKPPVWKSVT